MVVVAIPWLVWLKGFRCYHVGFGFLIPGLVFDRPGWWAGSGNRVWIGGELVSICCFMNGGKVKDMLERWLGCGCDSGAGILVRVGGGRSSSSLRLLPHSLSHVGPELMHPVMVLAARD